MLSPRAIGFDLDGTLIDSGRDIVAAMSHAFASTGRKPLAPEGFLRYVGDGARVLCARAAGLAESDPEVDRLLAGYVGYYVEHPVDYTTLMPGVRAALDALQAYPLAICTNKPRAATDAVLAKLGIASRFATILAGEDLPQRKPDPAPVLAAAERLGIEPAAFVMVGDGPQDVEAGRRAGARTVGVVGAIVPEDVLRSAGPDVLLHSMEELPGVMVRWAAHS